LLPTDVHGERGAHQERGREVGSGPTPGSHSRGTLSGGSFSRRTSNVTRTTPVRMVPLRLVKDKVVLASDRFERLSFAQVCIRQILHLRSNRGNTVGPRLERSAPARVAIYVQNQRPELRAAGVLVCLVDRDACRSRPDPTALSLNLKVMPL